NSSSTLSDTFTEPSGKLLQEANPVHSKPKIEIAMNHAEEYLTITEVAARLKLTPKTVRNKMAAGVFRKGVHYFRPKGLDARFKWGAVVAWLEQDETDTPDETVDAIPMARGYRLGESRKKNIAA